MADPELRRRLAPLECDHDAFDVLLSDGANKARAAAPSDRQQRLTVDGSAGQVRAGAGGPPAHLDRRYRGLRHRSSADTPALSMLRWCADAVSCRA